MRYESRAGNDLEPAIAGPRRAWLRNGATALVALVILGLLAWSIGPKALLANLAGVRPWPLLLAITLVYVSLLTRWLRWAVILRTFADAPAPTRILPVFLFAAGINVLTPVKLGDLIRLAAVRAESRMPVLQIVGTLALERVLDLIVLVPFFTYLGIAGRIAIPLPNLPIDRPAVLGMIAALVVAAAILAISATRTSGRGWLVRKSVRMASDLVSVSAIVRQPVRTLTVVVLSALAWAIDGTVFFLGAQSMGLSMGWQSAFVTLTLVAIQAWLPLTPGMIGTFHATAALGASLAGGSWPQALAYAFLMHAAVVIPQAVLPALCGPALWRMRRSLAAAPAARGEYPGSPS